MSTDFDELQPPRASSLPPALGYDATRKQMVEVLNALLMASRTHSVELEGIRMAVQAQGTRIELFCEQVELALRAVLKEVNHD